MTKPIDVRATVAFNVLATPGSPQCSVVTSGMAAHGRPEFALHDVPLVIVQDATRVLLRVCDHALNAKPIELFSTMNLGTGVPVRFVPDESADAGERWMLVPKTLPEVPTAPDPAA